MISHIGWYMHGTILRTWNQLAVGFLWKVLKYFANVLNFFEFTHMKEIVAAWLVYVEERGFNESFNHVS